MENPLSNTRRSVDRRSFMKSGLLAGGAATMGAGLLAHATSVRAEDRGQDGSLDAGDVIIHRVAQRFILRRGNLTGCVVNRGYAGGGKRLESGTVAPDVERRVQGGGVP